MARRILVAVDSSEGSRRAARFTNEFFVPLEVEVLVVNVSPSPLPWLPTIGSGSIGPYAWPPVAVEQPDSTMTELMDDARDRAQHVIAESGIDEDELIAEVGDPVDIIREHASAEDVDLIVVGASDKGWWKRLLVGSVTDELVRNADRPVLVVRS